MDNEVLRQEIRTLIQECFEGDKDKESAKTILSTLMEDFASWKSFLDEVWAGRYTVNEKNFQTFKKIVFQELGK